MRVAWSIAKREIRAFFLSPIAYVVLTAWLLWSGLTYYWLAQFYATQFSSGGTDSPLSAFFGGTMLFYVPLLVFVPALTMRLIAEERRSGTLEALLTAPVGEVPLIVGKYLAALVFWIVLWIPTFLYVWITSNYGDVDPGVVAASYTGILGIGLYYMGIGVLMSAASRNQVVAAVLTFLVLGALFALGLGEHVARDRTREIFAYISIMGHMKDFSKGVVDSRYLVFDVSLAVFAVVLAVRVLQARRFF